MILPSVGEDTFIEFGFSISCVGIYFFEIRSVRDIVDYFRIFEYFIAVIILVRGFWECSTMVMDRGESCQALVLPQWLKHHCFSAPNWLGWFNSTTKISLFVRFWILESFIHLAVRISTTFTTEIKAIKCPANEAILIFFHSKTHSFIYGTT